MKINTLANTIRLIVIIVSGTVNAQQTEEVLNRFPSSPIYNNHSKNLADEPLSCKTVSLVSERIVSSVATDIKAKELSLKYMNDTVRAAYKTMRNGVISHVTKKVALSLLDFSVNGFAAENLASYVSDGTKPFLPFEFANGVRITKVTPKGGSIIYKTEMPVTKIHSLAMSLALAGKISATTTICNDMEMVADLLGRDITIQYDYYDSNGDFFSSFIISG